MSWNLAVLLTNASNGSPVVGSPLTAVESPVMGPATPAVITDASGRANLIYNGDLSQFNTLAIYVLQASASAAAPVYTTWEMALTLTSGGRPVPDVYVSPEESPRAITNMGGWAAVKFKVYAVPGLPLRITARKGTKASGMGITVSQTPEDTILVVVGVQSGITVSTYA